MTIPTTLAGPETDEPADHAPLTARTASNTS